MSADYKIKSAGLREHVIEPPPISLKQVKKMWWALHAKQRTAQEEELYATLTANLTLAASIISVERSGAE